MTGPRGWYVLEEQKSVMPRWTGSPKLQLALVFLTCGLFVLSLVDAPYPQEQFLQHIPTVAAIPLLFLVAARRWLSNGSFGCLVLFLWFHIVAARYLYSYVPYDAWSRVLLGGSPTEWFGWRRNHFDRLVHACFGVLAVPPCFEIACRHGQLRPGWSIVLAVGVVMTISAGYEIFEWLITLIMAPEQAEEYNGQQGDMWDPQKDMALALVGTIPSCLWLLWRQRARHPSEAGPSFRNTP
jgi:putative membrane protein